VWVLGGGNPGGKAGPYSSNGQPLVGKGIKVIRKELIQKRWARIRAVGWWGGERGGGGTWVKGLTWGGVVQDSKAGAGWDQAMRKKVPKGGTA